MENVLSSNLLGGRGKCWRWYLIGINRLSGRHKLGTWRRIFDWGVKLGMECSYHFFQSIAPKRRWFSCFWPLFLLLFRLFRFEILLDLRFGIIGEHLIFPEFNYFPFFHNDNLIFWLQEVQMVECRNYQHVLLLLFLSKEFLDDIFIFTIELFKRGIQNIDAGIGA